jgi:PAS domain S-box-containing protein
MSNALTDPERLAELEAAGLLNADRVETFNRLARAAARANHAPVAQVNMLTASEQVLVAGYGPEPWSSAKPVSLEYSFCQHVVASGAPFSVEDARQHPLTKHSRATRETGMVAYAAVPLTTSGGHTLGSLCVVDFEPRTWTADEMEILRDLAALAVAEIEDRIRAEEQRRAAVSASETKLRLMVEAVEEYGIFMLDLNGRVVSWNPGAERITGYTEQEVLGKHFSIFYTEEDCDRAHPEEEMRIATASGAYQEEGWRVRKDGSLFWASVTITAVRDRRGRLVGFGKVTRDLTERKHAEEVLIAAKDTAEEANRAKSEFLATMSHELRTPLNAIIGYSDLLVQGIPDAISERAQAQVERIGGSAQHLRSLIEEILLFSRIESGQEELRPEDIRLVDLFNEVGTMIAPLVAKKGLQFRMEPPHEEVSLTTDRLKLKQILLNLLSNAIKFTKSGEVVLSASVLNGEVALEVRDTGIGIAPEHRERIFEPFVQINQSYTREMGGTGLGLTVARRLAQLLGGNVHVVSAVGEGARLRVQLPVKVSVPHA